MTEAIVETYDALRDQLRHHHPELHAALSVLAIPHWFDWDLGHAVVERFTSSNGQTARTLAQVTRLPFVASYEGRGWRLLPEARTAFDDELGVGLPSVDEVDAFIASWLSEKRNGFESSLGRELHWRFAYHFARGNPEVAVSTIDALIATKYAEDADLASAVELFNQRQRYLEPFAAEDTLFGAMVAYRRRDFEAAARRFRVILDSSAPARVKIIAGNLLGRIVSRRRGRDLTEAISILDETLQLAREAHDAEGILHVAATLADVLIKRGSSENLTRAVALIKERLQSSDHPAVNEVLDRAQLARALTMLGPAEWDEAERTLTEALEHVPTHDRWVENAVRLSLSELAEARGDIEAALAQMEVKLEIDLAARRQRRVDLDVARIDRLRRRLT